MKVVLLGGYPLEKNRIGGVQTYIYNLTKVLSKFEKIELHVVVMGNQYKTLSYKNMSIHIIRRIGTPLSDTILNVYPLIRKIKELNPDIIHCHNAFPPYSLATLTMKKRYPVLFNVLGLVEKEKDYLWPKKKDIPKKICYPFIEKIVYNNLQNIVVLTPYVERVVRQIISDSQHKFYVIPAGVDSDFFIEHKREQKDRLLYVGVIEPRKGILDLLKALSLVKTKKPNVNLHIVGKIKSHIYYQQLSDYIKNNKLSSMVSLCGQLSKKEIINEYKETSIFVFPSYEESFGIVLLEAMATGTPVIASSVGGIPYVVQHKITGCLVGKGDVEDLAKNILLLLNNEKERNRMGLNGVKLAKKFTWESIGRQTYKCYEEVIEAFMNEKQ
jgi:glycosyltransferase involved in cell wall biosynthesis